MRFKKVYFDLDGPILDVKKKYFHVHTRLCEDLGIISPVDLVNYWQAKRAKATLGNLLGCGMDDPKIALYMQGWLERIESQNSMARDEIHPFAAEVLENLNKHYQLILVTLRRNRENTLQQIEKFQLHKYFKGNIYIVHQNGLSPHILKHEILRSTGADQENAIFIGDTEVDINAAKLSGIMSVGVLSGIRNKKIMEHIGPDFIIKDIRGLTREVGL